MLPGACRSLVALGWNMCNMHVESMCFENFIEGVAHVPTERENLLTCSLIPTWTSLYLTLHSPQPSSAPHTMKPGPEVARRKNEEWSIRTSFFLIGQVPQPLPKKGYPAEPFNPGFKHEICLPLSQGTFWHTWVHGRCTQQICWKLAGLRYHF